MDLDRFPSGISDILHSLGYELHLYVFLDVFTILVVPLGNT